MHQRRLLDAFDPDRPSSLRTFDDVETFWTRTMRPRLRALHSMRDDWAGKPPPSATSRWLDNWRTQQQYQSEVETEAEANVQTLNAWPRRAARRHDR